MKVLHITPFYGRDRLAGGLGVAVEALARSQAADLQVSVFTIAGGQQTEHEACADGAYVHSFPLQSPTGVFFSRPLLRALVHQVKEFDIVHVHSLWHFPGTAGGLLAQRYGVPHVVSPHGTLNRWAIGYHAYKKMPYWYLLERRIVRAASTIHFTTLSEQHEARIWIGDRPGVIIPIPIVLPEPVPRKEVHQWRASLAIPPAAAVLGYFGRLHPQKGLEVVIDALALTQDVHLIIAGPDEEKTEQKLRARADAAGIAARVHWPGLLDIRGRDLLLQAIDLFVYPSHSENFGLAVAEAMAARVPVILTPGVNLAREIEDYGAARIVRRDPITMARAVSELLGNRATREAMGVAGRRFVIERFAAHAVARQMREMYEACLKLSGRKYLVSREGSR